MHLTTSAIVKLAEGNIGTAMALAQLLKSENAAAHRDVARFLERAPTVTGTKIYVLFNDLAERDLNQMANLCARCPTELLVEACEREDRSGRALVENYLTGSDWSTWPIPTTVGPPNPS